MLVQYGHKIEIFLPINLIVLKFYSNFYTLIITLKKWHCCQNVDKFRKQRYSMNTNYLLHTSLLKLSLNSNFIICI